MPKTNFTPAGVPAVQVLGLREVGVAPQADLPEACPAAQGDRPVEVEGRLLVAGPIAAAIDHEQRLARVGQREDQRMIAPLALVVDVHALLALAGGFDHRAVGVEDGFLEERLRLLPPDLQPRGVEDRLQAEDVGRRRSGGRSRPPWSGRECGGPPGRRGTPRRCAAVPDAPGTFRRPAGCRRCSARGRSRGRADGSSAGRGGASIA